MFLVRHVEEDARRLPPPGALARPFLGRHNRNKKGPQEEFPVSPVGYDAKQTPAFPTKT